MSARAAAAGIAAVALSGCAAIVGLDAAYTAEQADAGDAGASDAADAAGASDAQDATADARDAVAPDAAPYQFACGVFPSMDQWCPANRGAGFCAGFDTTPLPAPFSRTRVSGAGTIGASIDGNAPSPSNVLRAIANGAMDTAYLQLDGVNATISRLRVRFFLRMDQASSKATGTSEIAQLQIDGMPTQFLTLLVGGTKLVYFETIGSTQPFGTSAIGDLASCAWHEVDWTVDFAKLDVTVSFDGVVMGPVAWSGPKGQHVAVQLGITDVTDGAWGFSYDDVLFELE